MTFCVNNIVPGSVPKGIKNRRHTYKSVFPNYLLYNLSLPYPVEVIEDVPESIEELYNKKRIHSGISNLTPDEYKGILKDENKKPDLIR